MNRRIVSYNVNGLRAAMNKGLTGWLKTDPADIVCLQEIKATKEDVDCSAIETLGFRTYWFPARKKGYSGVSIFSRVEPDNVVYGTNLYQSDFE